MPSCSRSLRSQQHRERPYKGKRSQRCIFWAGFKDELCRCLAMDDLRSRSQRRAKPPCSLPGDVRVERPEVPRRTPETSPRGGKMRLETAARTEKVERPDISEARLTETQDHLLVEEALNGSSAAFGVLFERHQPRVLRVTWRVLRNQEDAEDAAQQAFEHAYVHLRGFHRQSRFSTWLKRIAINDALMLLRKRHPGYVSIDVSDAVEKEDMTVETHN